MIKQLLNAKKIMDEHVSRNNMPYAILINSRNFAKIEAKLNKPISDANSKTVYFYCGIPILINENYELKAVTEEEYREIYQASK